MLSHGQTVHFRPHSVIHHLKAMHHRIKMSYLEPILVHPVRRQIFGDTSGQTLYMTRDCVISMSYGIVYRSVDLLMHLKVSQKGG